MAETPIDSFAAVASRMKTGPLMKVEPLKPPPIEVVLPLVAAEIGSVAKGRRTDFGPKYTYRGIDDILMAVGPALDKHGVTVAVSDIAVLEREERAKAKGGVIIFTVLKVVFEFTGPANDSFSVTAIGEAMDSGDKGFTKAQSVALRTVLINTFHIPVDDPTRDTEHGPQAQVGVAGVDEVRANPPGSLGPPMDYQDSAMAPVQEPLTPLRRFIDNMANKTTVDELKPFAAWVDKHPDRPDLADFADAYKERLRQVVGGDRP